MECSLFFWKQSRWEGGFSALLPCTSDCTYEKRIPACPGFRGLLTKNHQTHRYHAQNREQCGHDHRQ